jgi:hypothetical protein
MKFYLVYLLNYKDNDTITLKASYQAKTDAINSLERTAIDYIKELQGNQQAAICKQENTPREILKDQTLKDGLYIIVEGAAIILYEKITVVAPGTLWNSNSLKINKVGKFYVTDFNFDDSIFRCSCMTARASTSTRKYTKPSIRLSFMDEFKLLDSTLGLKPLRKRKRVSSKHKTEMDKICNEIQNFILNPIYENNRIKIE